ncbi:GNAT family N-acetyltransferase [Patescibacteria group bacterium]|nr:GNAT family N-acetyltransferase [Patescibacteria group bacterium]
MSNIVFEGKTENGLGILIRYPTESDLQAMLNFINELSAERTFVRNQGVVFTLEQEKKFLDDHIKKISDKKIMQLLAFSDSKLVGVSGVDMKDRAQSHVGYFGISVEKDFRSKGVGSKLMEIIINEAEKNLPNLKIIVLTVFANNPVAEEMYKKIGFKEYGRLPKGITHRDKFVDEIYMYKNVGEGF